jgi:FAD/FMN-containing dehydrogenase
LVRGFNLRWTGQPHYVALCADTAQVVQAVQRAVDDGRRITVRSGGHCYEDFVCDNHDGVLLDLSSMNAVYRDDGTGWYCVEAGATLWDVYRRLYTEYGVTIPGGSCYSVGAGGHVTGAGYGLLSRRYGLTVDYLHAVEVVHVTRQGRAQAITVRRDSLVPAERDLLWAHLGGGGGNFGIVTKFWFRDPPPAPRDAYLLNVAWDWTHLPKQEFTQLMHNYGQFLAAHSAVDSPYAGLFTLLKLTHKAAQQIVLTAQYVGAEPRRLDDFARAVTTALSPPVPQSVPVGHHHVVVPTTEVQRMPWLFATQTLNGSGPNRRGKYKSAYMITAFPEHQIDVMWQFLTDNHRHVPPQALLQVDSYGCQVNAVAPDATAVPQRSSVMKLQYQAYWTDPATDAANLTWIRDFYTAMYGERGPAPDGTVDGCYVNYPDVELHDWQYLYYKDNYPRLQAVKGHWDPHNIFRHRQSIEPPHP